jgi:hypothetical protein
MVKGKTPVVSSTETRFGLNLISAISAQEEFRFMTVKGRVGAPSSPNLSSDCFNNARLMVILSVNRHPVYQAKIVKRFTGSVKDRFRQFLLPAYSPELNPDERICNGFKNNAVARQVMPSPQQLQTAIISRLRMVQKSPDRVRSYFQNEIKKYAA